MAAGRPHPALSGIKEDVYTPFFEPNPSLNDVLGLQPADIVVTIRPPATEAHYHNPESEKLLAEVFQLLGANPRAKVVLLPRTPSRKRNCARPTGNCLPPEESSCPSTRSMGWI